MKLRIISGSLKGRTINSPEKDITFRPTLERIRQSIADMINPWCVGAVAADLCAGSGAFGFEMLSRGAERVDFVENDRKRAKLIQQHAEKFGVHPRCRILMKDTNDFLRSCKEKYDIIFLDPPYDNAVFDDIAPQVMETLVPGGVLLFQRRRPSRKVPLAGLKDGRPFEIKTFGDNIVEIYKRSRKE